MASVPMKHLRTLAPLLILLPLFGAGCAKVEARGLAKEGNDLYRAGKFAEAVSKFEAATRLDPDFPTLQLHIGYANMALRNASEGKAADRYAAKAIAAFSRYMELRPGDERGTKFYLQMLLDSGRNDAALRFLERQHRDNPRDVKIVSSLGVVSSKVGRFSDALKWYEKRAALLPTETKARYLIGTLCWEHLYKNDAVVTIKRIEIADRGIAALQQALKLQKDYAEALTYINLLYRERAKGQTDPGAKEKDMAAARSYYKQAIKLIKAARARARSGAGAKGGG